ncbi:hypothetical protein [Reichenbachiella sp. MSK19-1]|uniref:hypothetical protein n=1 Tax=Reichenbachiella sp. MSK19-1 TaxID=1897631 RepID=UPI000E6BE3A1|nr:hypothetical protein [Reichenbachiella sp. MSK19-1]RJE74080.1 hypothetical protein BGP76_12855 [Reichenbachiella sp. MSK19-1]
MNKIAMYKFLLTTLLIFVLSNTFAQKYMDNILSKSCECVDKVSTDLPMQEFNLQLGLCMIEAAQPYKKQLMKDYDIDLENIDSNGQGEKLGRTIGVKMATTCPNTLMRLTNKMTAPETETTTNVEAVGTVSHIDRELFVVFTLKDSYDKEVKYYWLSAVESPINLDQNYPSLLGKDVSIIYETQELFDPNIEIYRDFNVIQKISLAIGD